MSLYTYDNALRLVALCEQHGIPILGIDSFIVTETKTQPYMSHSVDFSSIEDKQCTFDMARNFLKSKQLYGFVFEVVY